MEALEAALIIIMIMTGLWQMVIFAMMAIWIASGGTVKSWSMIPGIIAFGAFVSWLAVF